MPPAMPHPPLRIERLRRHGVALVLAVVAPFVALGAVLLVLSSAGRPHETTVQQVASPSGDRVVLVQRSVSRGGALGPGDSADGAVPGPQSSYVLTVREAGSAERLGCVQGTAAGQPLVQWVGSDAVRVSVLDAGRTVATTLSWDGDRPTAPVHEAPRLAVLHTC